MEITGQDILLIKKTNTVRPYNSQSVLQRKKLQTLCL